MHWRAQVTDGGTRQLPERVRQIFLERGLSEEMAQIGAFEGAPGLATRTARSKRLVRAMG